MYQVIDLTDRLQYALSRIQFFLLQEFVKNNSKPKFRLDWSNQRRLHRYSIRSILMKVHFLETILFFLRDQLTLTRRCVPRQSSDSIAQFRFVEQAKQHCKHWIESESFKIWRPSKTTKPCKPRDLPQKQQWTSLLCLSNPVEYCCFASEMYPNITMKKHRLVVYCYCRNAKRYMSRIWSLE